MTYFRSMWRGLMRALCAFALVLLVLVHSALAHPHIFADAQVDVLFNEQGEIAGVRQSWNFDALYSAWAVQGLDTNGDGEVTPEELQPLADDNMIGLAEYSYYTFAGEGRGTAEIARGRDARMVFDGTNLILSFTLDFTVPQPVRQAFEIEVGDPEYYVAFTFAEEDAAKLVGAPEGCSLEVNGPRPIDPKLEEELFALGPDVLQLPPHLAEAAKNLANVLVVRCDGEEADAAPAASNVGRRGGSPFVAPPQEPNMGGSTTGILGWINTQQKAFYQALTEALQFLKEDWNGFWALGGLSFLYGIFHAAGPGHGKVVISSYMVASERELRQGIVISFAAAMMQSVVAVAFVLVAAGLLRLTSFAMSDAAHWMAVGSYALVMLLGVYLVWRKLAPRFGGKAHDHHHHHAHALDHDHGHPDHDPETCDHCNHAPAPSAFKGRDWKAQLGLVMSVGLRPCSGALVVLAFALSQDLLPAGIAATFLMGLGTAITVSVLASLAVYFKDLVRAQEQKGGKIWGEVLTTAELVGAFTVFGFGTILLMSALWG
ncbi:DUF1007 family protein [Maritalea mediterranea]|uniref:DUF1007 family protein n=1 Tax=Maritalea mediterranea TaxID=2909667 RepID=A0ABS9EDQ4_9HYPH|nr:DUF1007 family protein [Maritalea mediterranea]MCF4099571.1 DUF1007 family protein [Maritalea mediterranea]